jgi:hypothetical protein
MPPLRAGGPLRPLGGPPWVRTAPWPWPSRYASPPFSGSGLVFPTEVARLTRRFSDTTFDNKDRGRCRPWRELRDVAHNGGGQ